MKLDPIIISVAVFLTIVIIYAVMATLFSAWRKEKELLSRTRRWSGTHEAPTRPQGDAAQEESGDRSFLAFLGLSGRKKPGKAESIYAETPLIYQQAGIYDVTQLRSYQALRSILPALPLLILGANHFINHRPLSAELVVTVLALAYFGFKFPIILLKLRTRSRKKELDRDFPGAIDLMMVCVEAGLGLDAAIRRVAGEIHVTSPELAKEFKMLSLELKSGKQRNTCLKNLAERAGLPDIDNLVNLLIQAERYGTGVANALRVHAEEMRQRRYARLEEQASKLPVKLVVPLVLCIFPALFVVVIGPGAIQIYRAMFQG